MKKYEKYKESGIQWIGQVPEHWKKKRVKHIAKLVNGYPFQSGTYCEEGKWNIITISNVKNESFDTTGCKTIGTLPVDIQNSQILSKGDLLISMTGNVGRVCFVDKDNCLLNQRVGKLDVSPNVDKTFLLYALVSPSFVSYLVQRSQSTAQLNVGKEDIGSFPIFLPPLSEQQAIAGYLDEKTGKIDESIEVLEEQKADLQKYRAAVISEAVTHGLDATAKMKDSGVLWIGQIPKGWRCLPVKRFSTIQTGCTPSTSESKYFDGDFNWFTPSDFKGQLMLSNSNRKLSQCAVEERACRVFPAGSVYIIGIGGTLGKVSACSEVASANQQITVISPNSTMNYKFLAYFLSTKREIFETKANAATLPILSSESIASFPVPVPPLSEQQAIADYLDEKTGKIDEAIATIDTQIADLRAYRTALITEVVTGKVKVSCGE
ncbi:MAG: restriction endonuclease subunit S [Bacteroidales bacterium]|nr:restriction endonuclease subunit S [Candidatus Colicola caccequi]